MYNILVWIPAVLWMALIFYLSHQPATDSKKLSGHVTGMVVRTVKKVIPNGEFKTHHLHHMVRKNAHFLIYLVLGILVMNALRKSEFIGLSGISIAFMACLLYAITDEVHQLFVPGRGAQVSDVMIDTAGSSVGIGLYVGVLWMFDNFSFFAG